MHRLILKFSFPDKTHGCVLTGARVMEATSLGFTQHALGIIASFFPFCVLYCVPATLLSVGSLSGIGLSFQEKNSM